MCSLHRPCGVCLAFWVSAGLFQPSSSKPAGPASLSKMPAARNGKTTQPLPAHRTTLPLAAAFVHLASHRHVRVARCRPYPLQVPAPVFEDRKNRTREDAAKGVFLRRLSVVSAPCPEVTGHTTSHQFFSLCRSSSVRASLRRRRHRLPRARPLPCAQYSSGWTFYRKLGPPRRRQRLFVLLDFFFPLCLYVKSCSCREWRNEVFSFIFIFFFCFSHSPPRTSTTAVPHDACPPLPPSHMTKAAPVFCVSPKTAATAAYAVYACVCARVCVCVSACFCSICCLLGF